MKQRFLSIPAWPAVDEGAHSGFLLICIGTLLPRIFAHRMYDQGMTHQQACLPPAPLR
jgi:hypothetical protein